MNVLGSASGTGIYKRIDKYQVGLCSISRHTEQWWRFSHIFLAGGVKTS